MPKLKDPNDQPLERLLSDREILESLGINQSTLNRWRKAGRYPQPIKFSSYTTRTPKSAHDAFIASLVTRQMADDKVQRGIDSHPKNRAGAK
jgi:predicted DNA-binding transcriptional regulator AlpA